ncbi:MAG: hypothetical protein IKR17_05005 [Bacteroidales bacterium]|nr:hypothetical protein [Bacteroidales bacterium]
MSIKNTLASLKMLFTSNLNLPIDNAVKVFGMLVFFVFIYITNHLWVERDLRKVADLSKEIKELRYEQITTSAELMNMSKQSEVIRRVEAEELGLHELTEPPRIIEK